ncbi:ABC-type glutathione transport system ATPase component [Crossiella equi]|uniref:ABC-type glutathione transport system ATPase component n=1 Tax=Crossiella equi TaxID=130796 RepID=A0ABS5A9K8_9PSEU|nr:ABC transporter ATP-binding protein [Crossiella equi]MBP2473266.1 ABC-type glutathione transport system ATPase component [Crossiella equi]
MSVLRVSGLTVATGGRELVRGVSFEIGRGERVGLIGESGSGKTLTAYAVLGLLPEGLTARGEARLAGTEGNLFELRERELARIRGRRLAMVFQEPMTALNPAMRIGRQVAEAMTVHRTRTRRAARLAAVGLLDQVRLPDPATTARAYPHELSGGQRQRVLLAMALANDPDVLVCDEPTTALDVTVQARLLTLIRTVTEERGTALLFITHDLAVVADMCERVLVMREGLLVDSGALPGVFRTPAHEYTRLLLAASELPGREAP